MIKKEWPTSDKLQLKINRIKEVLEEKGLTQIWLAEKLGNIFKMVNFPAIN